MPPDRDDLNDPGAWMSFAKSDLALARKGNSPEVRRGALCYHCQQAAEKALKAVLLGHHVDFPPTHNLKKLLDLLPAPLSVPRAVADAASLSDYALKGRYPLDFLDVSQEDYRTALKLAAGVILWAEKALRSGGYPDHPTAQETPARYRATKRKAVRRHRPKNDKW